MLSCMVRNSKSIIKLNNLVFSGICMRRKDNYDRDALHFAPFVLFPTPFPRDEYTKAVELQTILNELMHKVLLDVLRTII